MVTHNDNFTGGARYTIRVKGILDERRAAWLGDMHIERLPDGFSRLDGWLPDQSALFGLLSRVRDLGLELWSVERLPATGAA